MQNLTRAPDYLKVDDLIERWAMISIGEVWLPATVVYVDARLIQVISVDSRRQTLQRHGPGWRRVNEKSRASSGNDDADQGG
jgi:hypothetical protein